MTGASGGGTIPRVDSAGVAQLVEQRTHKPRVAGSSPAPGTSSLQVPTTSQAFSRKSPAAAFFRQGASRVRLPSCLLTALAALLFPFAAIAQTPAPEDVDALVRRYFEAADDAARAEVLKAIQGRKDVTIEQVEDAVHRGVWLKGQPSGTTTRKIAVAFNKEETDCTFWAPPGYDEKKAYPAIVIMHGTGGTGEEFLKRWLPYAQKRNMIVIAPTQLSGVDGPSGKPFGKGHGYGTQELERSTPVSAVDAARRIYNIDSNRIIIAGTSMGGHCAWDSILTRTDYFAGAIVEAGVPMVEGFQLARTMPLPNLFQARMYVVQGTPDKDQPMINQEATNELKRMGCAVVYRQLEGAKHGAYQSESDPALDFVTQGARDVWCRKVTKVTHRVIHGRAYWVRIDKLKGLEWNPRDRIEIHTNETISAQEQVNRAKDYVRKHLGRVDAAIAGENLIDVKTSYVSEFTLFLHDKLVDMDKPITIKVNGRAYKKTVKRDVGFMLDEVRKDGDKERTFYAAVKMNAY